MVLWIVIYDGENVLDAHGSAETEVDIVAEEEALRANGNHVPRDAVVIRGEARGGEQRGIDAAELRFPIVIEELEAGLEIAAVLAEALANDLVGACF